jgi:hypothetical protein
MVGSRKYTEEDTLARFSNGMFEVIIGKMQMLQGMVRWSSKEHGQYDPNQPLASWNGGQAAFKLQQAESITGKICGRFWYTLAYSNGQRPIKIGRSLLMTRMTHV